MKRSKKQTGLALLAAAVLLLICGLGLVHFHLISKVHQSLCRHLNWENGACTACGLTCEHDAWENGRCAVCGLPCEHRWENGCCTVCGSACVHEWENAQCQTCGLRCDHPIYDHGVCTVCGTACSHDFREGICVICGEVCGHANHDPITQQCTFCGLKIPHSFIHGKCACGAVPVFYDNLLPSEFYQECEHPGTVQKQTYIQKLHYQGDEEVTKNLNVYLPYGYTGQEKYNVLVLIHGGGDDEDSWLTKEYDFGFPLIMKNIYDNMIEQKLCRPLIIVCPTTYNGPYYSNDGGIEQMAAELRETILPYVAEHYSTYAESGSLTDLQAAREHFGIGGMSNGALYALNSGMQMDLDLFSNFICFSGNSQPYAVAEAINSETWKDLPISFFYAGAGYYDGQWQNTFYGFQIIVDQTDRLTEGENAFYRDIDGGHDFGVWNVNIFNALQMAFPEE